MTAPVLTGTGSAHTTGTGAAHTPHRGDDRVATCVEIAWGYDPGLPFGDQWVDVTDKVRSLSTTRGRQAELQRFETGTAQLLLDNRGGDFSPWNTAGDYYPGVRIGVPIRVRISAERSDPTGASPDPAEFDPTDGGFFYAWSGFIETLQPDWSPGGMSDATCVVTAADAFGLLNRANLNAVVFPENDAMSTLGNPAPGAAKQYAADRLLSVLGLSGIKPLLGGAYITRESFNSGGGDFVPFGPIVDSGAGFPFSGNPLAHMQDITEGAFQDFYVRPDNTLNLRPYSDVRNQAFDGTTIFGENPGEIPYMDVGPSYNDDNLYNDAQLTFPDNALLTAQDATSIAQYSRRVYQKSPPIYTTTVVGGAFAAPSDIVARYKDPVVQIPSVQVSLHTLTDAQRMRVLTLPIGYRVQVKRRPVAGDALTAECHFEGVQLSWDPGMKDVKAVLNLAPTRPVGSYPNVVP